MGFLTREILSLFDYTRYPAATVKKMFGPAGCDTVTSSGGTETVLLGHPQTKSFEMRSIAVTRQFQVPVDGRYSILIVTKGAGEITGNGIGFPLPTWSRVMLPAILSSIELRGQFQAIRCLPPWPEDDYE
jgi:mannose-6-phosphate isomerase class I